MRSIFTMVVIALLSGVLRAEDKEKPAYEVADVYQDMRGLVLKLDDKQMPDWKDKPVWAVMMETGFAEAAYTLIATTDGSASLYFSNGGGIIGAGQHAKVRDESLKMVKQAEGFLKHMKKVEKFPLVRPENTTFYIVTPKGVFSYTAKEQDLGERRDKKLSALFHQGHALITQIRIVDEQRAKQR